MALQKEGMVCMEFLLFYHLPKSKPSKFLGVSCQSNSFMNVHV